MRTQLTSYTQNRNANTSAEEWNDVRGRKNILLLIALPLSLVLTARAAWLCVPWQPFPGRAAPGGAGSEESESVPKLSQTKHLLDGFTEGKGVT